MAQPRGKPKGKVADVSLEANLSWTNAGVYQGFIQDQQRLLDIDKLCWGGRNIGQIGPLTLSWVQSLKASLNCCPTARYVECRAWDGAGTC